VQRVDQQEGGPQLVPGPAAERAQVGEVADAGAGGGEQRVELDHEAEAAQVIGQAALAGADHQPALPALTAQEVVPERQLGRQASRQAQQRAVLGQQLGLGHLALVSGSDHQGTGQCVGLLLRGAHGRQQGLLGAGRGPAPLTGDVVVAGRDAPRLRLGAAHPLVA
jgi:hypothetical protein